MMDKASTVSIFDLKAFVTEEKQWVHQKQNYDGGSPRRGDSNSSGLGNAKVISISKSMEHLLLTAFITF